MVRKTSRTSRGFHGNDHITSAIFNLSTLGPHRNLYDSNSVRLLHQERQPKDPDRHDGEKERERRRSRARRGGARRTGTIQDGETSSHSRPGAVPRRRSPGAGSWALVQPAPWTQKRWVGVVVTIPPPSVVGTLQVTASSCTGATRTLRASSAPVWGVAGRDRGVHAPHRRIGPRMGGCGPRTRSPTFNLGDGPGGPIGHDRRPGASTEWWATSRSIVPDATLRYRVSIRRVADALPERHRGPGLGHHRGLTRGTGNRCCARSEDPESDHRPIDSAARRAAAPTSDGLPQRSALG